MGGRLSFVGIYRILADKVIEKGFVITQGFPVFLFLDVHPG